MMCEPVAVEEDGWSEWIHPTYNFDLERGFLMQCCDCSLIHELEFAINLNNELIFRARRHETDSRADEGSPSEDSGEVQLDLFAEKETGRTRPDEVQARESR